MSIEKRWFVSVGGGEPVGPVTLDQLVRGTQAGKIPFDAVVCPEGATAWTALSELPELRAQPGPASTATVAAVDSRRWFVRAPGAGEAGPITTAKLLRSIQANGIPRDSQVREEAASTWLPILGVPELAATFMAQQAQPTAGRAAAPSGRSRGSRATLFVLGGLAVGFMLLAGAGFGLWRLLRTPSAADVLEPRCAAQDPDACAHLALFYLHGAGGLDKSRIRAEELYTSAFEQHRKQCAGGNVTACKALPCMILRVGVERRIGLLSDAQYSTAKQSCEAGLKVGCKQGDAVACAFEAELKTPNLETFTNALWAANDAGCRAGKIDSCIDAVRDANRGLASGLTGKPREDAEARVDGLRSKIIPELERRCERNQPESCGQLCLMLNAYNELVAAVPVCEKACEASSPDSCVLFARSKVSSKDKEVPFEVVKLERRACYAGSASGCMDLSFILERGLNGPPDTAEAGRLLRVACDAGEFDACDKAGIKLFGSGVTRHEQGMAFRVDAPH